MTRPHPPSRGARHPPPEAVGIGAFPLQAKFPSNGGVATGRGGKRASNYPLSLLTCHSRVGGNRAWVVLIILFGEYFSVVFFYSLVIRDMNLIDPIPALSTPQIHSYLRGPRARE